ncbi:MAG TPA: lactate dehydrogenase [Methanoregula sp.]|nr:lactate dehydrogenase [Methanoregula sp.]
MTRLAVVGVGRVGGEVAYLAAAMGIVDELALYDRTSSLLKAQVLDIRHTGLPVEILTGQNAIRDADVCVFSAGVPRTPDIKTRADLLKVNLPVINQCARLLEGFSGLLVTVTNPMDVNNYLLHHLTGLPRENCIGFGGQLDSARFALSLCNRNMKGPAMVLGEHGEYQVPVFSRLPYQVPDRERDEIQQELRGASMEVIKGKGGTVFGPAYHITSLVRMLIFDSQNTIPSSAVLDGEYGLSGCSLGVPVRVGKNGIHEIVQWDLDAWEREGMDRAGTFVRDLSHSAVP